MPFRIHSHANGSHTLVDEENGQAMHSRIGPRLEANLVYAARARIEERLSAAPDYALYDVGLGTGSNVTATLDRIRATPAARGRLRIFSFETKPDGLGAALANLGDFPELADWAGPLEDLFRKSAADFRVGDVDVEWRLLVGDFYARMSEAPPPDDLFFDFYSPKIVPELWSYSAFARIREKIGERDARLFTYSAATPVRVHLFAAGFFVGAGVSTGVKSETTIAATRPGLLESPLSKEWLRKLETSASVAGPRFDELKIRVLNHPQWKLNSAN